jgi:class 3 adenylate cyclase/tetratricopeptide (TPR) repeat protein
VTTLFCDLVGFTAASEAADPEDVDRMLAGYFAAARVAIEAFGGVVEKFIGDAVVGVFGVPAAHEDDPERAVRAGLRIVGDSAELRGLDGDRLRLRVGINTGEAFVRLNVGPSSGQGFLTGDAVNIAARIQSMAPDLVVAVGQSTYHATRQVFDYEQLPMATVKGKTERLPIWRAVTPLARVGADLIRRHDSRLIGRDTELALLRTVFKTVVTAASPQLLTIVGDPGLGKSRLVAELSRYLDDIPTVVTWRQGRCLPYGQANPFGALAEIVTAHAGIFDADPVQVTTGKLDQVLPDSEDRPWLRQRLLPLLGIDATSTADQPELFAAWVMFCEHLARQRPTVLVFEDVHWADPALLTFLRELTTQATNVPLLVVATARPEFLERNADFGADSGRQRQIRLAPLTDSDTTELVRAVLDAVDLPADVTAPILRRSGGNPLFAQECARLLIDQDLIEATPEGRVRLRTGAQVPLPDTVQALISARLDTLPAQHKNVLANAAVIGASFWVGALAAMTQPPDGEIGQLGQIVQALTSRMLIRPVLQSSLSGQTEYSFQHDLTRDAAYRQLPRAARAARHLAAASWLEAEAGSRAGDFADVLAHHYTTALALAEVTGGQELVDAVQPKAAHALTRAGQRAISLDTSAAVTHLERAVELAPPGAPGRGEALLAYARASIHSGQLIEAQAAAEEAVEVLRADGDAATTPEALLILRGVYAQRADPRAAGLADEAARLLDPLPPGPTHIRANIERAAEAWMQERHRDAIDLADEALALAKEIEDDLPPGAIVFRAMGRAGLGDLGALDDFHDAIAAAMAGGQGRSVGLLRLLYQNLGFASAELAGAAAALADYDAGLSHAAAYGLTALTESIRAARIDALVNAGQLSKALAEAADILPHLEASGDLSALLDVRYNQIRALTLCGRAEQADSWLDWLVTTSRGQDAALLACGLGSAALAHAARGRDTTAITLLHELAEEPDIGRALGFAELLPTLQRTLLRLDQPALADRLTSTLVPTYPYLQHTLVITAAQHAEATGDHRQALTGYTDAAHRWHDFTMLVEEAFALLGQGRCLIALNRPDEAAPVLQQARDMFAQMGAQPALTETETLLTTATSGTA